MPDLVEQMYCSEQITVPPNLPTILKKYAKAAIRTQPNDLLVWSVSYFKALTYGIPLPTKPRIEYPPVQTISGLTPGFLKVLINQLGNNAVLLSRSEVCDYWKGVCLSTEALEEIFAVGGFGLKLNWLKFIAICAGYLETSLTRTMILLCELLTEEPIGGSAHLPINKFLYLYKFLARLECGPKKPEKPLSKRISVSMKYESDESEALSGEGISYKGEIDESVKNVSAVSWQSVLKRMGKRESDVSDSTVDPDKLCNKEDYLSRGIAWKQILDIGESEPDTSLTHSSSGLAASSMGLQIFENTEDELENVIHIPQKKEETEMRKESFSSISRSDAAVDLRKEMGEKSLDEILTIAQEFETTTKMKEVAKAESDDEEIESSLILEESEKSPVISQRSDEELKPHKTDFELNVLVKPDSSTILVPSPPKQGDVYGSIEDIQELVEEPLSECERPGMKGSFSLHDLRIPQVEVPTLMQIDKEDFPMTLPTDQIWVHIAGIGSRVPEENIKQVENYLKECAEKQSGTVMPRNLRHFLCPSLDPQSKD